MPTNRTRRSHNIRPDVSPMMWAMLTDAPMPADFKRWEKFKGVSRELWMQYRDEILADWCRARPGTRPSRWWQFDAPGLPQDQHGEHAGRYYSTALIVPRERLGGKGTPSPEVQNIVPEFRYGIPTSWADALAIKNFGKPYREFFDPSDPPTFESQAAYLRRHGLLLPGEIAGYPRRTSCSLSRSRGVSGRFTNRPGRDGPGRQHECLLFGLMRSFA